MSRLRALWRSLYIRRRWLTIGIGVKRWLVLMVVGAAVTSIGWVYLLLTVNREGWLPGPLYDALTLRFLPLGLRVVLPLLVGGVIILVAVVRLGKSLVEPLPVSYTHLDVYKRQPSAWPRRASPPRACSPGCASW